MLYTQKIFENFTNFDVCVPIQMYDFFRILIQIRPNKKTNHHTQRQDIIIRFLRSKLKIPCVSMSLFKQKWCTCAREREKRAISMDFILEYLLNLIWGWSDDVIRTAISSWICERTMSNVSLPLSFVQPIALCAWHSHVISMNSVVMGRRGRLEMGILQYTLPVQDTCLPLNKHCQTM